MPGFLKRFDSADAAVEAARRSACLAGQGVMTPAARASGCEVTFDRLAGETGKDFSQKDVPALLSAVLHLHRAQVPGLPRFDPFLRIRPRATLQTRLPVAEMMRAPVPTGSATLHGDLHIGQFIRDAQGVVWLVDLDDLAIGPPEADIANFTAHLATTFPDDGIDVWARHVKQTWRDLGAGCEDDRFETFLTFALLRRHLKLRDAGRPDFESTIVSYLRDNSNFSIR